jgi:phosphoglycolate phosphatase-like HAD superfamily hydrolase
VEKLQSILASPVKLLIITTKEGRFVQKLLQQQGVQMPQDCILGKESKRPKPQILRELTAQVPPDSPLSLWFVEDRLKTLQAVQQQSHLDAVKLYLADWGYNTPAERESIRQDPRIKLLSLPQFALAFSDWR